MSIPLAAYIRGQVDSKLIRLGLLGIIILMVLCVLGTYSRGGLVGLVVLALFYFKESNNKFVSVLILVIISYIGANLMPDAWFERMDTIQSADNDLSFMGRVSAWKISTLLALDRPFLGGGMKAAETYSVWLSYAVQLREKLTFIDTPPPDLTGARAAHSIYFQVLGDAGFVGLFLFVSTLGVAYRKLVNCTKKFTPKSPQHTLAKMLKLSLIMYIVVGLALSKAYFDLIYAVYALIRVLERQANTHS
jgi:probable O-glycosylation ligase (exosortase A-associated)